MREAKELFMLLRALNCFTDLTDYYVVREEFGLNSRRDDVEYFLEFFQYLGSPYFISKEQLKAEIIEAFRRNDDYWIALNNFPIPDGFHITATELWWGIFPDDDPSNLIARGEGDYGEYHLVMLKFMVKKLIWDTLWSGEDIPNYKEPENGSLLIG